MPQTDGGAGAYLIALNPALLNREYAIVTDRVVIGRDGSMCEVVCSGNTISRRHCAISRSGDGGYAVEDLRSTNGTYVNRQRVTAATRLHEGDAIGLGTDRLFHLRFQAQTARNRAWTQELPPTAETARNGWTIGRSPDADVSLPFESTVSSRHAVVRLSGSRVHLSDAGSLNGTWVNGRRIRRTVVDSTDAVMVGSTLLRFEPSVAGGLHVERRDCGDEVALECVALTRDVSRGRAGRKRILDNVTMAVRPGEFVGLLGPSGAGKSTLLKALNGFNPPTYGCVLLNETPLFPCFDMFRNAIGYVPQDDIVYRELTVAASLDYVARLRLPSDVTDEQRRDLIDSTLETLGLSHVRGSRVSELSGGQRKRVSIGCELITRPSLLFLDEPTSGMDPSTEERLMRHFQSMARRGTTVLITTHILYNLDLLDRVGILSRGRMTFFGTPKEAMEFFTIDGRPIERPTQVFEILEGEHLPADAPAQGDAREAIAEQFAERYRLSEHHARHVGEELSGLSRELCEAASGAGTSSERIRTLLERPTAGSRRGLTKDLVSPRAWWTLTRRNLDIKLVSPKRAAFYLAVPLILALVTLSLRASPFPEDSEMEAHRQEIARGLTHRFPMPAGMPAQEVNLDEPVKRLLTPDGEADSRSGAEVVYALKYEGLPNLPTPMSVPLMLVMTAVFMGTLLSCLDLSTERPIYVRERMAGQRIADYLGSKLPFLLLATAAQCAVFLAVIRVRPELREFDWGAACLAMVAMAWTACTMGLFVSAIDPTPGQFSVVLGIVAVLPQLVLSGGLGPDFYAGMPGPLRFVADALPARWGLEMLMTAFFYHPERAALAWVAEFVPNTVGFGFGPEVYLAATGMLGLQGAMWLVLSALAVKRLDRQR